VKECTPIPSTIFIFGFTFESIKEFKGASCIFKQYILVMNFSNEMGENNKKNKKYECPS